MTRYYLDANIILDFLLNRVNEFGQNLRNRVKTFFDRLVEDDILIISDHSVNEVMNYLESELQLAPNIASELMDSFIKLLEKSHDVMRIRTTQEMLNYANKISMEYEIHFEDALHVSIALHSGEAYDTPILITRNIKDFVKVEELIKVSLPENAFLHR